MFKRLKRIYIDAFKILKEDFLYYVGILMLARFVSLQAIKQISTRIFHLAISSIGLVSINSDNISEIFTHPITLSVLLIAIMSVGFFMLLENAIILNFANRFYSGAKTSLKKVVAVVFRPSSILFTVYLILILPNVEFGMSASYLSNFQIPRFMIDAIYEQKWMTYTYIITLTLAFIASLYLYYLPAIYLLEDDISFIEAAKKSIQMIKGELFEVIFFKWSLGLAVLAFSIISYGFAFGFVWLSVKFNLPWIHLIKSISTSLFFISLIFAVSMEKVLSYLSLLSRYHLKRGEPIQKIDAPAKKFMNDLLWIGTLVLFASGVVVAYNYNDNKLIHRSSLVAAHRGDTSRAIENTIESLTFANEIGADLVELDIQKTKDDVIVVFHDENLARLGKNKKRVDELTFEEINNITLNNGKFTAKMPDFDSYLKQAKLLDQSLLLELKSIRTDVDAFVHETMALLDKYDYRSKTIIQSLDKRLVESMKRNYPGMEVGYILGFNVGAFEEVGADFYSLEDGAIKKNTIPNLRKRTKGIYVWTVNKKDRMTYYFDMDVNGIISDQSALALSERDRVINDSLVSRIWNIVIK